MAEKMTFDDFAKDIEPLYKDFVMSMHEFLSQKGYGTEIKPAAQGPVVSYLTPKTKRTVFNYVFRKNGMQVRIYADNVNKYQSFLDSIPKEMQSAIFKAPVCKRLINPNDCNSRCTMGYDVLINGDRYQRCRYGAFMFGATPQNQPYIKSFIEQEVSQREIK